MTSIGRSVILVAGVEELRDSGMVYQRPIVGKSEPFKLKSIRKERSPAGAEGIDWHCYVITQGDNTIVGHRQGSTSSVRLAVEGIVLHLNERRVRIFQSLPRF